jgi:hypothetical protein
MLTGELFELRITTKEPIECSQRLWELLSGSPEFTHKSGPRVAIG